MTTAHSLTMRRQPCSNGNNTFTLNFSTNRGCVVFSNCTRGLAAQDVCQRIFGTASECANAGGSWLELPLDTQEKCEGTPLCHVDDPHWLLYPKETEVCEACEVCRMAPLVAHGLARCLLPSLFTLTF